jgi:hypothetical protein
MNALPTWYVEGRKGIESFYIPKNLVFEDQPTVSWSPTHRYHLIVERYCAGNIRYTRGKVYLSQTQRLIADIKRNHQDFLYVWVQQEEREYLVTGEDSQGYTVVDLGSREISSYIDEKAEEGLGFKWSKILPSPDGKLLAVTGEYFPGMHCTIIYDFSKPDEMPLPKLSVVDSQIMDEFDIVGWTDNRTLELQTDTAVFYDALTGTIKKPRV